jgi:hypothetical protein
MTEAKKRAININPSIKQTPVKEKTPETVDGLRQELNDLKNLVKATTDKNRLSKYEKDQEEL